MLSGDTLQLTDKRIIKLADIKAPELWVADTPYKSWPFAYQARDKLSELVAGKAVTLYCGAQAKTLTGNSSAHVLRTDGLWIQRQLLQDGSVFFFRALNNNLNPEMLLNAEKKARESGKGLWQVKAYQVRNSTHPKAIIIGWFQVVEGQILSAKRVKEHLYLNFGPNWRKDFTLQIPNRFLKQLKLNKQPSSIEGKYIRVRGWAEWAGGPKIILDAPQNLEILPVYKQ